MKVIDLRTDQEVEIDSITFDEGYIYVRYKTFYEGGNFRGYFQARFKTLGDIYERFADIN